MFDYKSSNLLKTIISRYSLRAGILISGSHLIALKIQDTSQRLESSQYYDNCRLKWQITT